MLVFQTQRRSPPLRNPLQIDAIAAESFYTGGKAVDAGSARDCLIPAAIQSVIA